MASFVIRRETALPGILDANTVYLVAVGVNKVEIYVTGNNAVARRVLNQDDVEALINAAMLGIGGIEVVANIIERDALVLDHNTQVFVIDATGDATVNSGGATYVYQVSNNSFTKISEAESLDVALSWATLVGKPTSSVAAIDAAVAASHTHPNKTQLDQIGQSESGDITYNGREYVRSGATEW